MSILPSFPEIQIEYNGIAKLPNENDLDLKKLYDLALHISDLDQCKGACLKLLKNHEAFGAEIVESIWGGVLVRYGRCFNGGVRYNFSINIDEAFINDAPAYKSHSDVLELRNRHVAHDVSILSRSIGLLQAPHDGKIADVQLQVIPISFICYRREAVTELVRIIDKVRVYLEQHRAQLTKSVVSRYRALTWDEYLRLPDFKFTPPKDRSLQKRKN